MITETAGPAMRSRLQGLTKEVNLPGGDAATGPARCLTRQPQLPCDQHALDLAGALADLQDLGVAPHTGDRVLVHETVAAVDLRGVTGVVHGDDGGVQLGEGRLLLEGFAGDQARGRVPPGEAGGVSLHL